MTYAQTAGNLSTTAGVPFVTVGVGGGFTFNITNYTDVGAALNAAIAAVTSAGANYNKTIWLFLSAAANFSTPIILATNVTIIQFGGGSVATGPVIEVPAGYLNYNGAGGASVDVISGTNISGVTWFGLSLQIASGITNLRSCVRLSGARQCSFYEPYINDPNAAAAATANHCALLIDGNSQTGDGDFFIGGVFIGALALQIGIAGESGHMNDTIFQDCDFEGPALACDTTTNAIIKVVTQGGNIQFYNSPACHTPINSGQFELDMSGASGGSTYYYGGEIGVSGGTAGGGVFTVGGGTLAIIAAQWSSGAGTASGGFLDLTNVNVSGASCALTSSGALVRETGCNWSSGSTSITHSSGEHYLINSSFKGTLTLSSTANFYYDSSSNVSVGTVAGSAGTLFPPQTSVKDGGASWGWGTYTFTGTVKPELAIANTFQKAETGADANVLTYTPPAIAGHYLASVGIDCSIWAANMSCTLTYHDSNGSAVSKALYFTDLTTGANLTVIAAAGNYGVAFPFDIDNSATTIVFAVTGAVGNTYKISVHLAHLR